MGAKTTIIILAGLIAAVLIAVGLRLGDEARAMMLGSICGIAASIPVTIGIVLANTLFTRPTVFPSPKPKAAQGVVIVKCKHDTNLMEMRCPVCEMEGVRYLTPGQQGEPEEVVHLPAGGW